MAKRHFPKIEIRQKEDSGGAMTGANTEILMDGKPLKGVMGIKFQVTAGGVAKVNLDMIANVAVIGQIGDLEQEYVPLKPVKDEPA